MQTLACSALLACVVLGVTATPAIPFAAPAANATPAGDTTSAPILAETTTSDKAKRQMIHHGGNASSFQHVEQVTSITSDGENDGGGEGDGGGRQETASSSIVHHTRRVHQRGSTRAESSLGQSGNTAQSSNTAKNGNTASTDRDTEHGAANLRHETRSQPSEQHASVPSGGYVNHSPTRQRGRFTYQRGSSPREHKANGRNNNHPATSPTSERKQKVNKNIPDSTAQQTISHFNKNFHELRIEDHQIIPLTAEDGRIGHHLVGHHEHIDSRPRLHPSIEIQDHGLKSDHAVVITKDGIQSTAFSSTGGEFQAPPEKFAYEKDGTHLDTTAKESVHHGREIESQENIISSHDTKQKYEYKSLKNNLSKISPHDGLAIIYRNEYNNPGQPNNFKEVYSSEDLKAVEGKKNTPTAGLVQVFKSSDIIPHKMDKNKFQSYVSNSRHFHHPLTFENVHNKISPLHIHARKPILPMFQPQVFPSPINVDYKSALSAGSTQEKSVGNSDKQIKQFVPVPLFPSKNLPIRMHPHVMFNFAKGSHPSHVIPFSFVAQKHIVRPLVHLKTSALPQNFPGLRYVPLPASPHPIFSPDVKFNPLQKISVSTEQPESTKNKYIFVPADVYAAKLRESNNAIQGSYTTQTDASKSSQEDKHVYEALVSNKINFQDEDREESKSDAEESTHFQYLPSTHHHMAPTHQSFSLVYHPQIESPAPEHPTQAPTTTPTRFTFLPADAVAGPGEGGAVAGAAAGQGHGGRHGGRQLAFGPAVEAPLEAGSPGKNGAGSSGWKPILRPRDFPVSAVETIADRSGEGAAPADE